MITLLALFLCGAVVTQVTSRAWWFGGLRQTLLGAAAAALTYGFGALVGTVGWPGVTGGPDRQSVPAPRRMGWVTGVL